MSFLVSPPEIISSRLFSGAGPGSLLAAAASWQGLSSELQTAASSFGSLTSTLASGPWQGAASAAMMTVAAGHVQWLTAVAARADETSAGAMAAVSAFEAAQASTVHPLVVAANRARFVSLALSNLFGLNAPAIAATEAHYAQMWAQDVEAMVGYHGAASAAASSLQSWEDELTSFLEAYSNLGSGNTGGLNLGNNNTGWLNIGSDNSGLGNIGNGNIGNGNLFAGNAKGSFNLFSLNATGFVNFISLNANGILNFISLGNTGNFNTTNFNPAGPELAILALLTPEDPLSWIEYPRFLSDLTGGLVGIGYPHPGLNNLPFTIAISGGNNGLNNFGGGNFGEFNFGHGNLGDWNKGSGNIGIANSGSGNIGNYDTGSGNIGDHNTAGGNIGSYNVSAGNIGNHNVSGLRGVLMSVLTVPMTLNGTIPGIYVDLLPYVKDVQNVTHALQSTIGSFSGGANIGDFNVGSANFGSNNFGSANIGDFNVGSVNVGSHNVGFANTGAGHTAAINDYGLANTGSNDVGFANTGNHDVGIGLTGDNQVGIGPGFFSLGSER